MLNMHTSTSIKVILVTCKHRQLKTLFLIFILKGFASSQPTSLQPLTTPNVFQKMRTVNKILKERCFSKQQWEVTILILKTLRQLETVLKCCTFTKK